MLLAGDGAGTNEIAARIGVPKPTVIAWKRRDAAEGVGGLQDRPRPGRPRRVDETAIVLRTLEPPPERLGVTHRSSRLLTAALEISNFAVAKVWQRWRCSAGGWRRSSSRPTRSSRRRPATWSGST